MPSKTEEYLALAQRPDAAACADFDIWNNRMNRYVRRGSKGIALLNVSDTGVRRNSRDPDLWQYKEYSYLSICCKKSPKFGQN